MFLRSEYAIVIDPCKAGSLVSFKAAGFSCPEPSAFFRLPAFNACIIQTSKSLEETKKQTKEKREANVFTKGEEPFPSTILYKKFIILRKTVTHIEQKYLQDDLLDQKCHKNESPFPESIKLVHISTELKSTAPLQR